MTRAELQKLVLQMRRRAFDDPDWFFRSVMNHELLAWQLRGINAMLDVQRKLQGLPTVENHEGLFRITIRSCHGTGKTHFLGAALHIWNFIFHGLVAATAPKQEQLITRLWPRYRAILRNANEAYKAGITVQRTRIECWGDPDWGVVAETASDPENLAGYHNTPQLFLVDEASSSRLDAMYPVIEGALTTPGSVVLEIGNPTRTEGEFWSHHNKLGVRELYYRMHVKAEDAPQYVSQAWIDTMIQKYGRESPITKIRAFGEFASFDEYILIPVDYIDEALDCEEVTDGSHPKLRVSVDVADGGQDSTVITVARHYETFVQVLKQKAFWFPTAESPILAAEKALEMFKAFGGDALKGDDFVVDSLGVGSGTAGMLIKLNQNVVIYKGGEASDMPSRFRNRRVQSYIGLYDALRDQVLRITPGAIDDEEELRAHLVSIKRRPSNDRVDDIEPKDKIKQDGLPSPDRADSLAMQYATQVPVFAQGLNSAPVVCGQTENANYDAGLI